MESSVSSRDHRGFPLFVSLGDFLATFVSAIVNNHSLPLFLRIMHNAQFFTSYYNESAPVAIVLKSHFAVLKCHILLTFHT